MHTRTLDYHSATKEILPYVTTQITLEDIMLSKRSQSQRTNIPLIGIVKLRNESSTVAAGDCGEKKMGVAVQWV